MPRLASSLEPALSTRADDARVLLEAVLVDDVQHRQPRAIETGLPPKVLKWSRRVSVSAISGRVVHGAERRAVADALGHRDDVGHHAPVLEAPVVLAGAAEAGLHLVGDAEAAVLADDVVGLLKIVRRACVTPPTPWIGSAMNAAISPGVA